VLTDRSRNCNYPVAIQPGPGLLGSRSSLVGQHSNGGQFQWSAAIVSARETIATLAASIDAVIRASSGTRTQIDVIVNGNHRLAKEAAEHAHSLAGMNPPIDLRIWAITTGDKANALNQYIHEIYSGSEIAFFVDGYAQVAPDAFRLMAAGLAERPDALAISGIPTVGRTARTQAQRMIRGGGGHGTLNALRGSVCLQLREINFRLPLGLYRVDGLLFAVLAFNLDPACNSWDLSRLLVDPSVTWSFRPLTLWRLSDLQSYAKRLLRQAQGLLENQAFRQHLAIERKPVAALPRSAAELINSWLAASPARALSTLLRQPLSLFAARRLRQPQDWADADLSPEMIASVSLGDDRRPEV